MIPSMLSDLHAAATLRRQAAARILTDHAGRARATFAASYAAARPTPVVIPARNEQYDLPATLLALAHSISPVIPIVVDNGSLDDTAGTANRMGAHVIGAPTGTKMAATQAGLSYAAHRWPGAPILFTDADTLALPTWASAMGAHLTRGHSAVFGTVLCWHGSSRRVDAILSSVKLARSLIRAATGQTPVGRGANYGLRLDPDGTMAAALLALDPDLFAGDDTAIRDALHRTGTRLTACFHRRASVLTRNDRYHSLAARYGPGRHNAYQPGSVA